MTTSMFANVLVAIDGGELTKTLAHYALRAPKTTAINFLCAVDPGDFMSDATAAIYGTETERTAALQEAKRVVDDCVAGAQVLGFTATGHVIEAAPVDAIIGLAEKLHADVIVMASHGRSGLARLVLGSVADGVARRARIPVLLVPADSAANHPSPQRVSASSAIA
jgi:nucleotide-binding universal stress UspA family protein